MQGKCLTLPLYNVGTVACKMQNRVLFSYQNLCVIFGLLAGLRMDCIQWVGSYICGRLMWRKTMCRATLSPEDSQLRWWIRQAAE